MRLVPVGRRKEGVFGHLAPGHQVVAHGVHHRLFRLPRLAQVRVVAGIEDMVPAKCANDRAGEDVQVLIGRAAAREHLAVLAKVDEIVGADLQPRRPFAVVG